jgi:polyisoprenoid-binding protein YceI
MLRFAAVAFAAWVVAEPASAQSVWRLDRGATEISFITRRFGAVVATGRFGRYDGSLTLDFDRPERSRVRVTIETASLQAGSALMDNFIKGQSMLDVGRYPTASFVSSAVTRAGERSLEIRGQLTIRTVTAPIVVRAVVDGDIERVRRGDRLPFHASGTFMRPAFELGRDVNVVDDLVELAIRGELTR